MFLTRGRSPKSATTSPGDFLASPKTPGISAMKRSRRLATIAFCNWILFAHAGSTDLWQGSTPPGELPATREGSDPRGRALDPQRLTDVATPTLTCRLPAKADGRALVICPGGAYRILATVKEGVSVADRFAREGVTTFTLHYRVPVKNTAAADAAPREDLAEALRQARARMKAAGFPEAKVGVLGFSAGGHLALAGAYGKIPDGAPRPDFVIAVYPAYLVGKTGESLVDGDFSFCASSAPACLIHAADDPYSAKGSVLIWQKLHEAGVRAEMHVFSSGGHGFGLCADPSRPAHHWPEAVLDWMRSEPAAKPNTLR